MIEGESERWEEGSLDGEVERGVLTGVLVWGWTGRGAPGGTGVCFCSDGCGEKWRRKENINVVKVIVFDLVKLRVTSKVKLVHKTHDSFRFMATNQPSSHLHQHLVGQ